MFDLCNALRALDGRKLTLQELKQELERIQAANLGELPPEIGVRELLLIARENRWIVEDADGNLEVRTPKAA